MAYFEKRVSAATGKVSFKAQIKLKGHPTQTQTFTRLTDARAWAASIESALREGRSFVGSAARNITLSDLIADYRQDTSHKILKDRNHCLLWWEHHHGGKRLAEITPALIKTATRVLEATVSDRTGKPLSSTTVRKHLATLSKVLAGPVSDGVLESNPVAKTRKPPAAEGRTRFLDDGERERLLQAASASSAPCLYPIIVLALSTGCRYSEILNLCWKEPKPSDQPADGAWGVVDLAGRKIVLHQTKNGSKRVIPLAAPALDALTEYRRHHPTVGTDLCFPGSVQGKPFDIRKPWERALAEAGITGFHFHDLRHTAASYFLMSGATLAELSELLGHKSLAMVKRYSHLAENHTRGLVDRMAAQYLG